MSQGEQREQELAEEFEQDATLKNMTPEEMWERMLELDKKLQRTLGELNELI